MFNRQFSQELRLSAKIGDIVKLHRGRLLFRQGEPLQRDDHADDASISSRTMSSRPPTKAVFANAEIRPTDR